MNTMWGGLRRRAVAALALGLAVAGAGPLSGCGEINITIGDSKGVKGSGVSASETRAVTAFTAVEATGSGKLKLVVGPAESLRVTADDNLLPLISSEVRNGVLVLSTKGSYVPKTPIVFEVNARSIERIENSGAVTIDAGGFSGGKLTLDTSGVGTAKLAGRVDTLKIELSGVGSVDSENLVADRVDAELSGVGSGTVRADKSLKASVSGVGSLTWTGTATDVKTSVSGVGKVSRG
ncbi:MAG: DUF2807 domain-containing protein [Burkholderiales bacterium]|nr:DUF2807 domain-containing protein [Burkholderiales bacterium]